MSDENMKCPEKKGNKYCYIARVKAKRDLLISGHVGLNKCHESHRTTGKNFPAPIVDVYIKKPKTAVQLASL